MLGMRRGLVVDNRERLAYFEKDLRGQAERLIEAARAAVGQVGDAAEFHYRVSTSEVGREFSVEVKWEPRGAEGGV